MHVSSEHKLELPESLQAQLFEFRQRLWMIKLVEACCGAVFGVLLAFLTVFVLDRFWNTPPLLRFTIFVAAVAACALIPVALHRWVWRRRRLEQLARLLGRKYPSIGDQILGIVELVKSEAEQARSIELCQAAITQVADQAEPKDFSTAVPNPRHLRWAGLAAAALTVGLGLCVIYPAASANSWSRFLTPWRDTPRYTFTQLEPLPDKLIVPHGEPFSLSVRLSAETKSHPKRGEIRIGERWRFGAQAVDELYNFEIPPQIDNVVLNLRIGDFQKQIAVEPTLRPELSSVTADVVLPPYLEREEPLSRDVRGGVVSLVSGSRATFVATATRELAVADVDGQPITPQGLILTSPPTEVDSDRQLQLSWRDALGLAGKEPFTLSITAREDEPPSITCQDLPRRKIVLDSEQLSFQVFARDDFGVKRVGIDWHGLDDTNYKNPAEGEKILAGGGPRQEVMELAGTFSAKSLGIEPQPIALRLFAEDFFPDRRRVYSPTYLLYILTPEQHAIWLTEQLSKWHRQSLDVRDRELQLYETNKQLRELPTSDLEQADTRDRIESQASAERANGRRLSRLVNSGEDLIKQAMRNPEFGVGHLEQWAEMLQILKDISGNRMPSVADLLKQASGAPNLAQAAQGSPNPMAGQVRAMGQGKSGAAPDEEATKKPPTPTLVDVESSHQPPDEQDDEQAAQPGGGGSRLGLPVTTLLGASGSGDDACPVSDKMDEAVTEQQDLLAEFEKIADELNRLLANLEGSTLVKRLKAASRLQYRIAGRLGDQVDAAFGVAPTRTSATQRQLFSELAEAETQSSQDVSHIMDDMQAYFERRRFMQFKAVLDDMREQDVIGSIRQMADDIHKKSGLTMAQCEYWSDSLDRWAEDLVEPTAGGT